MKRLTQPALLILLIITLISVKSNAQSRLLSAENKKADYDKSRDKVGLKFEYFGELGLHPGIALGLDYELSKKNRLTLHWNSDLGGYYHKWNNTSIFVKSSIGARFTFGSVFTDVNAGIGYLHSFSAGDLYERTPEGGIDKARNLGHAHFMPNASLLVGCNIKRINNAPLAIHFGPEMYLQSRYNHIYLPHLAVKLGFTYKLK